MKAKFSFSNKKSYNDMMETCCFGKYNLQKQALEVFY